MIPERALMEAHFSLKHIFLSTGDSRYTRGFLSCESPRISKTRKTGNVQHGRGFSEWYTVVGLIMKSPDSKWRGESVKLRAQLSEFARQLLPWLRVGFWYSPWYWNKTTDTRIASHMYITFVGVNTFYSGGPCCPRVAYCVLLRIVRWPTAIEFLRAQLMYIYFPEYDSWPSSLIPSTYSYILLILCFHLHLILYRYFLIYFQSTT
jgi:hypothetical protein